MEEVASEEVASEEKEVTLEEVKLVEVTVEEVASEEVTSEEVASEEEEVASEEAGEKAVKTAKVAQKAGIGELPMYLQTGRMWEKDRNTCSTMDTCFVKVYVGTRTKEIVYFIKFQIR